MFLCSLCNNFGGQSFSTVLRHIGETHRHDPCFQIQCGLDQCPQTYKNFESFRSHVYRKHRDVLYSCSSEEGSESSWNDPPTNVTNYPDDNNLTTPTTNVATGGIGSVAEAKFIMKTREEYRIPQSTVNALIQDVDDLCCLTVDRVKTAFFTQIEELDNSDHIQSLFLESLEGTMSSPFQDLNTQYKQTSYFKEHLDYVVCYI